MRQTSPEQWLQLYTNEVSIVTYFNDLLKNIFRPLIFTKKKKKKKKKNTITHIAEQVTADTAVPV